MKRIAAIFRSRSRFFASVALFAFGSVGTAFAENISKTFEFGPGTANPSSNVRTYPVPSGRQVAAVVKFQRLGPAGASKDIPIKIEFREPDTAPNQEGPITETRSATATTTEQTVTIFSVGGGSSRGCTLPWRVRVRYANAGTPPFAVSGTSKLDYDGRAISIPFHLFAETIFDFIPKGTSKTVNFGDVGGLKQGRIEVTAWWMSELILRFQLIDPSGTVVRTTEGKNGMGTRFKLIYQVPTHVSGQWKLRVINPTGADASPPEVNDIQFTPGCP